MRPGLTCHRLYQTAAETAEEAGLGRYFMRIGSGPQSEQLPFIGHGLGLELNEPPLLALNSDERLEQGMVVTLELLMGGRAAAEVVKLEDTVLITEDGAEILCRTPRELQVL
jgi:Xaa-Pro aminopeptidase